MGVGADVGARQLPAGSATVVPLERRQQRLFGLHGDRDEIFLPCSSRWRSRRRNCRHEARPTWPQPQCRNLSLCGSRHGD